MAPEIDGQRTASGEPAGHLIPEAPVKSRGVREEHRRAGARPLPYR